MELLQAKADRQGLSLDQLYMICELSEDLEQHGNIQALMLSKTSWGCRLSLFSVDAGYEIDLVKNVSGCELRVYRKEWGNELTLIHESDNSVRGFEKARELILIVEGYEVSYVTEPTKAKPKSKSKSKNVKAKSEMAVI